MKAKIFKTYKGENSSIEVDESDVVKYCEERGYWKEGTALKTLYEHRKISTPWAEWKIRNTLDISFINKI